MPRRFSDWYHCEYLQTFHAVARGCKFEMASSKRDFERFVTWLHQPESQTPPDVRRLANLVLAHFDELA